MATSKPGLYANIHAIQERISHGSKKHIRMPSDLGASSFKDFEKSKKTPNFKRITK